MKKLDLTDRPSAGAESRSEDSGMINGQSKNETKKLGGENFGVTTEPRDTVAAYRHAVEAKTISELDELSTDPDSMRMQVGCHRA